MYVAHHSWPWPHAARQSTEHENVWQFVRDTAQVIASLHPAVSHLTDQFRGQVYLFIRWRFDAHDIPLNHLNTQALLPLIRQKLPRSTKISHHLPRLSPGGLRGNPARKQTRFVWTCVLAGRPVSWHRRLACLRARHMNAVTYLTPWSIGIQLNWADAPPLAALSGRALSRCVLRQSCFPSRSRGASPDFVLSFLLTPLRLLFW